MKNVSDVRIMARSTRECGRLCTCCLKSHSYTAEGYLIYIECEPGVGYNQSQLIFCVPCYRAMVQSGQLFLRNKWLEKLILALHALVRKVKVRT